MRWCCVLRTFSFEFDASVFGVEQHPLITITTDVVGVRMDFDGTGGGNIDIQDKLTGWEWLALHIEFWVDRVLGADGKGRTVLMYILGLELGDCISDSVSLLRDVLTG